MKNEKGEELYFYVEGEKHIYDSIVSYVDDYGQTNVIGRFSRKTLTELQKTKPGMRIITETEYNKIHDEAFISEASPISEEQFYNMFETLPPIMKKSGPGELIFAFSEFLSGTITGIYAKIGNECWMMNDHHTIKREKIIEKINAAKLQLAA